MGKKPVVHVDRSQDAVNLGEDKLSPVYGGSRFFPMTCKIEREASCSRSRSRTRSQVRSQHSFQTPSDHALRSQSCVRPKREQLPQPLLQTLEDTLVVDF